MSPHDLVLILETLAEHSLILLSHTNPTRETEMGVLFVTLKPFVQSNWQMKLAL
jgi:hypothetical protein